MKRADFETPIYLIAERFGHSGGGEAIKAYQYAQYLCDRGRKVVVFTHERSVNELGADMPAELMRLVPDTVSQKFMWHSRIFRVLLQPYFHWKTRRLVLKEAGTDRSPILHYISPVSPVAPRFAPAGFSTVFGPMTGNIYYPPGFKYRMSLKDRLREKLHKLAQLTLGRIFPEKRRATCLLVSGYERTRASLELAGCDSAKMTDVVDAGVNPKLVLRPRVRHAGPNSRFMCSGRLVDHKGIDLAIRAVAKARPEVTLDIYGDGTERPALEALVAELGLQGRVSFKGWVPRHDDLIAAFGEYRGYLFPSLAEANGIVMQEAMMVGLPVITLRWGGPSRLANDTAAIYVEPTDLERVTADLAAAMDRLATDGEAAENISLNARQLAEQRFSWTSVAETWEDAYTPHPPSALSEHGEAKMRRSGGDTPV